MSDADPFDPSLEADTERYLIRLRELVGGLRAALDTYDAAKIPPCASPCKLCAAIALSRDHLRQLEAGVVELESRIAERPRAVQ